MADDAQPARSPAPTSGFSLRRTMTSGESPQLRQRPQTTRFPSAPSEAPARGVRRRSSNFSDYSLNEARRSFQSSTDDLLLPKPRDAGAETNNDSSAWHSAPLAFALLPAIGGMFFKNGSSVITDIMLLGLAAIFLNWSVRLPWDWYQSAQAIRKEEEDTGDTAIDADSEDESALNMSQATLDEVAEDAPAPKPSRKARRRRPAQEAASKELYRHELLALLSCFVFPILGAYLLHTLRSQLSRPSEGLVSNYNLSIFLLASELRPMAHLVKLIQSRTLYLQRIVNSNPYTTNETQAADVKGLLQRLEELEARSSVESPGTSAAELGSISKQSATLTSDVRRAMQPDLDALTRAVRRYEKRAALQTFQTETKLLELEARLNDAVSLAAAAASERKQSGFTGVVAGWAAAAIAVPFQVVGALASLPLKMLTSLINLGRTFVTGQASGGRKNASGKYSSRFRWAGGRHVGDRR